MNSATKKENKMQNKMNAFNKMMNNLQANWMDDVRTALAATNENTSAKTQASDFARAIRELGYVVVASCGCYISKNTDGATKTRKFNRRHGAELMLKVRKDLFREVGTTCSWNGLEDRHLHLVK